jgi:hypothetical protein
VDSALGRGTTITFQFSSPIKEVLENNKRLHIKAKKIPGFPALKPKKKGRLSGNLELI